MKDYRDEYEKCGHCTSTFRNKHQLRQHVMMIHPRSYFKEYGKSEETEEEWIKFSKCLYADYNIYYLHI